MRARTGSADCGDLQACRALLRHLNNSRRLRDNPIARRILGPNSRATGQLSDSMVAAEVLRALESALDGLSMRQQTIVRRCDIGGERYGDVARSLGISERHAFRERDAAVRCILQRLAPPSAAAPARVNATVDGFWLQIASAQALEHNGNWQAAAAFLDGLGPSLADIDRRCFLELRLARVYRDAERFALAEHHLGNARTLGEGRSEAPSWQRAEVEIAVARLADATGDSRGADRLARRACLELQSWAHTSAERRIADALVDGLTLRAEKAFNAGDLSASLCFASAACGAGGEARFVDPQFAIAARVTGAMAKLVQANDWHECERELLACYAMATRAGLTRQAIVVATHLAGCLRLAGHPRAALDLLTPLLQTARTVGGGEPVAILICELVSSNLESRQPELAAGYLDEMREHAIGNPLTQVYAELVAAKAQLALHNDASALRLAERAESVMMRIGKERLLGTALRLQAEALAGLGQTERAIKTIGLAIEQLSGRTHPTKLGAAYRVLGRLSGDAKHSATARRLLAQH